MTKEDLKKIIELNKLIDSIYAMHKNFRYELCETNEDSVVIGNIYEGGN